MGMGWEDCRVQRVVRLAGKGGEFEESLGRRLGATEGYCAVLILNHGRHFLVFLYVLHPFFNVSSMPITILYGD